MRFAVLLLLTACSAPQGEFHRGTFAPVPAPSARPGVGAPVVGQPNAHTAMPRTPHKRHLPPMKEPGLWSGDVRATAAPAEPTFLGVPFPFPETATTHEDRRRTFICADSMTKAIQEVDAIKYHGDVINHFENLPPEWQRCAAAQLYELCAKQYAQLAEATPSAHSEKEHASIRATRDAAVAFKKAACDNITPTHFMKLHKSTVDRIVRPTYDKWYIYLLPAGGR